MKLHIAQLLLAFLWILFGLYCLINNDNERFYLFIILSNIWLLGSQITYKLKDK